MHRIPLALLIAAGSALGLAVRAAEPPAQTVPERTPLAADAALRGEVPDPTGFTVGIRGIVASSQSSLGVGGQSIAGDGTTFGVLGRVHSAAGAAGCFDNTAGGGVLLGRAGVLERFRVEGTGAVIAGSFAGDGAGLTGLDPAQLAPGTAAIDIAGHAATAGVAATSLDLECSSCVAEAELTFDPATQSELAAVDAALAAHLGAPGNPHAVTIEQLTPSAQRGDLLVEGGAHVVRLPAGSDGQVLATDAGAAAGLGWADGAFAPRNDEQLAPPRWYAARSGVAFAVGDGPVDTAFDGDHIWVTRFFGGTVSKLRASDGAVLGTFPVGTQPRGVAFDGVAIWVVNSVDGTVSKLRASDGAALGTFTVGTTPVAVAFDGIHIWVSNFGDNTVTRLLAGTGGFLDTLPVGNGPWGMAADGAHVWVVSTGDDAVSKLRASDGAVLGTFPVGGNPRGVAFDGSHVWVTNAGDGTVTKLRASDGTAVGTFPVGVTPFGVVFDGRHVWVANASSDTVTKLRASDGTAVGTFAAGTTPFGLAFDGANVWVASFNDNAVGKL